MRYDGIMIWVVMRLIVAVFGAFCGACIVTIQSTFLALIFKYPTTADSHTVLFMAFGAVDFQPYNGITT
jgi:hypothetical protein